MLLISIVEWYVVMKNEKRCIEGETTVALTKGCTKLSAMTTVNKTKHTDSLQFIDIAADYTLRAIDMQNYSSHESC